MSELMKRMELMKDEFNDVYELYVQSNIKLNNQISSLKLQISLLEKELDKSDSKVASLKEKPLYSIFYDRHIKGLIPTRASK